MRIALLTDIHGNDVALQAVLLDIQENGGADAFWVLGDLAAIGPAPAGAIEMLLGLPGLRVVRGNTDRYVCAGDRPGPTEAEVIANPHLLQQMLGVEADFSWTQGAVTQAGWFEWLSNLPVEYRTQLPDGTRVLCVHASPGTDDGPGFKENMPAAEVAERLSGSTEDLVIVGHTHRPFSLELTGVRIINPGSVSNPVGADVRACYALIEAHEHGYKVNFRRVGYDVGQVLETLEQMRHPARRFIGLHLRGEIAPSS